MNALWMGLNGLLRANWSHFFLQPTIVGRPTTLEHYWLLAEDWLSFRNWFIRCHLPFSPQRHLQNVSYMMHGCKSLTFKGHQPLPEVAHNLNLTGTHLHISDSLRHNCCLQCLQCLNRTFYRGHDHYPVLHQEWSLPSSTSIHFHNIQYPVLYFHDVDTKFH